MASNVSSLPTALSMQMPITNRIQMLKRRSRSLSSDSSSFSLPFKKRRFVIISDNEEDDHGSFSTPCSCNVASQEQRETMVTSPTLGVTSVDKGIACITPVPKTLKERQVSAVPKEIPKLLVCNKAKTIVSSSPHSTISEPMQTRRRSKNNQNSLQVDTNLQSKRMSYPKLDSPLPNGCHGKTSRTQSFCRRGPNYNGSNYCKLHYFDPRCNKMSTENCKNEESISDTTITKATKEPIALLRNENESITKTNSSNNNNNNSEPDGLVSTRNSNSRQHERRAPRDKLYRGPTGNSAQDGSGAVEVRCLAISTRGKRCCYAAVTANGNEYCHRHSSFKGSNDKNAIKTTKTKNVMPLEESLANTTILSSRRRNRSSATSQKAKALTAASDPRSPNTLSDLSTDLWQNRRVLVLKGPHQSKIGTVVRWRNGWVTVELTANANENAKTKNPMFHNRRSYELILV